MSLKLFEQFLHNEISRRPSLANALNWKDDSLIRCSQLFDKAAAALHFKIVRQAVWLILTRQSNGNAELQQRELTVTCDASYSTTSCCSDAGRDRFNGSGETNFDGSNCSPKSRCTNQSGDASCSQYNNSQQLRRTPRSPARFGCCGISGSCGGGNTGNKSEWTKVNNPKQPTQQQPCQLNTQQQQRQQYQYHEQYHPQQQQPCRQYPNHKRYNPQQQQRQQQLFNQTRPKQQTASEPQAHVCRDRAEIQLLKPLRPQPVMVREGPAYNYPTANPHNRQKMAGWYVANMDALLSNLMHLFEKIYANTLQMCGANAGGGGITEQRNALPDPTLLSMQQRAGGNWRPNYMSCKIDFLLHIAAMVYRNTQDLRCGCQCSQPADPCAAFGEQQQFPQRQQLPQQQQFPQQQQQQATHANHKCCEHLRIYDNADTRAAVVTTDDGLDDTGDPSFLHQSSNSSWQKCCDQLNSNRNNARRQLPTNDRQYLMVHRSTQSKHPSIVLAQKLQRVVNSNGNLTSRMTTALTTIRHQSQKRKKRQQSYSVVISEDIMSSSSESSKSNLTNGKS